MKPILPILILIPLALLAAEPPPPTPPAPLKVVGKPYALVTRGGTTTTNEVLQVPYRICTGIDTNGHLVMATPPSWMLAGPPTVEPHYQLTVWDDLRNQPIVIRVYPQTDSAFFQGGLQTDTNSSLFGFSQLTDDERREMGF